MKELTAIEVVALARMVAYCTKHASPINWMEDENGFTEREVEAVLDGDGTWPFQEKLERWARLELEKRGVNPYV